jgi:hypothetical protein
LMVSLARLTSKVMPISSRFVAPSAPFRRERHTLVCPRLDLATDGIHSKIIPSATGTPPPKKTGTAANPDAGVPLCPGLISASMNVS